MKLSVYASATALEQMARGEAPGCYALDCVFDEKKQNRVALLEDIEVPVLPRALAAELAVKMLRAEAEMLASSYKERIAKLLAIEYTPSENSRDA